jgi:prevent-host-death family protein
MARWQVQDAKARFSEFLDASLSEGPQIVTRRGVETAVLLPIDEWHRLQTASGPTLKEWLLSDDGPRDLILPERGKLVSRPLPLD